MARKLRLEFAGACYHVINRGNYKFDLFAATGAARSFQHCIFDACGRFGWRLHAFVIMRNHFHLALETPEPNLSLGMKRLQYRWSSLAMFSSQFRSPALEPGVLLGYSGGWADNAAGWRGYRRHLEIIAKGESGLGRNAFGRLSRGWAIGSPAFHAKLNHELVAQPGVEPRLELLGAAHDAHLAARSKGRKMLLNSTITSDLALTQTELPLSPATRRAPHPPA